MASVCPSHAARSDTAPGQEALAMLHQCKAMLSPNVPFEMALGGRFRGSAHEPKAPECCSGAGSLQLTPNLILDESHVPGQRGRDSRTRQEGCTQEFSPACGSANVEVSEIPNLGIDTGKLGPTGKSNSGQVIYLAGDRDGGRRVVKRRVKE